MLRMKVSYYSRSHSSEFIARQAFIAQSKSSVLNLLITTFARDALTIVGLVVVMVSQDPLLSLFALMFLPLAAVGVRKIGLRVRKIMASKFQGAMQMMESLQETAQGIRIVKAFTLESFMRDRQARAIEGFQGAANKLARVSSRTSPIPWRLRYRRRRALQRLRRDYPRQSAGKSIFLHHFGHHALRANEAGR
jgi:ATP-binding cassette, subfamily B, bacterial MsbA